MGKHHQNDQVRAKPPGLGHQMGLSQHGVAPKIDQWNQLVAHYKILPILGDGYQSMFIGIYNMPTISNYD